MIGVDWLGYVACLGLGVMGNLLHRDEAKAARNREAEFLKMIRSLQNRISAKDLHGFAVLESQQNPPAIETRSRSDEAEAEIDELRRMSG